MTHKNQQIKEAKRLLKDYSKRDSSENYIKRTSILGNYDLYFQNNCIENEIYDVLNNEDFYPLENKVILDLGGGDGNKCDLFTKWGGRGKDYHCVDLFEDRVRKGKTNRPLSNFAVCNGISLPYKDESFDIVLLFMVFDSVLDADVRKMIARDSVRVLKKNGVILLVDFRSFRMLELFVKKLYSIGVISANEEKDTFSSVSTDDWEIRDSFAGNNIAIKTTGLHPWFFRIFKKFPKIFYHLVALVFPFLRYYNMAKIKKNCSL